MWTRGGSPGFAGAAAAACWRTTWSSRASWRRAGATLTEDDVAMLDRLLDLPDNDLWDLIAGRAEPADATVRPLLAELRSL